MGDCSPPRSPSYEESPPSSPPWQQPPVALDFGNFAPAPAHPPWQQPPWQEPPVALDFGNFAPAPASPRWQPPVAIDFGNLEAAPASPRWQPPVVVDFGNLGPEQAFPPWQDQAAALDFGNLAPPTARRNLFPPGSPPAYHNPYEQPPAYEYDIFDFSGDEAGAPYEGSPPPWPNAGSPGGSFYGLNDSLFDIDMEEFFGIQPAAPGRPNTPRPADSESMIAARTNARDAILAQRDQHIMAGGGSWQEASDHSDWYHGYHSTPVSYGSSSGSGGSPCPGAGNSGFFQGYDSTPMSFGTSFGSGGSSRGSPYSSFGSPMAASSPLGSPRRSPYSSFGSPMAASSPLGSPRRSPYSSFGSPMAASSPLGSPRRSPYSSFGPPLAASTPQRGGGQYGGYGGHDTYDDGDVEDEFEDAVDDYLTSSMRDMSSDMFEC